MVDGISKQATTGSNSEEQIDVPTKKVLTMEQVGDDSSNVGYHFESDEVVEGKVFGDFEITEIREVKCEHSKIQWQFTKRITDGGTPEVTGKCKVCHEEFIADVSFSVSLEE